MRFGTRILRKTRIKLIDGSAKGPCGPKTGQKVVFLEVEKGFSKNPFSKGISDPKTGLKSAIRPHPEKPFLVNFRYDLRK